MKKILLLVIGCLLLSSCQWIVNPDKRSTITVTTKRFSNDVEHYGKFHYDLAITSSGFDGSDIHYYSDSSYEIGDTLILKKR